jgi:TonB family protein
MDLFEPKQKTTFTGFFRKHASGIYGTLVFHLILAIILLSSQIYSYTVETKESFLLVLPQDGEWTVPVPPVHPAQAGEAMAPPSSVPENKTEQLSRELDRLIAAGAVPRNVAVDAAQAHGRTLRDDRRTDVSQLYGEAREVQQRIDASRREAALRQGDGETGRPAAGAPEQEPYRGPSVLSYELGGRKHLSLPVPVYQCSGGGDVTVQIEVNPRGYVTGVSVQVSASVDNSCLYEAARRAARRSRFTVDAAAPARQKGEIIYRFVPQ